MKRRIIESLANFSKPGVTPLNNQMFRIISEETGIDSEEIKKKSTSILKSIIHNYAAFEVSTIDGFTHRVLRTFARDLGIPMNFEVELSTEEILMEAVDSLISRAGTDEKLTRVLVDFTLSKTDEDKSWDISRDLFEISRLLVNENNQKAIKLLKSKTLEDFEVFTKELKGNLRETKKNLKNSADLFFEIIHNNGIEEKDFSGGYVPKHFAKLQSGNASVNFETKWAKNIEDLPLYPKKCSDTAKVAIDSIQPQIVEIFEATKKAYFQIEFLEEIQKNLVQLSLLNEINHEVEEIKKERNIVLISEFYPKISEQVKDQPAPFIYERLGERYHHYFIDEFQDTSIMQWENLIPLINHNLSGSEISSGLTIVGDAKQSIYRWRGGRAEQLIDLSHDKNPFQTEKTLVNLPDNYRSGSVVVNFNNSFFNYAASMLSFPDYAELFQESSQTPKKGNFGYVNLSFLECANREEEYEIYPEKILEIIRELDEKQFERRDICILTRTRKEGVKIAEYLSLNQVPVVSSETLLLSQSDKVNFIINLLSLSVKPSDEKIKFLVLDYLTERYLNEAETYSVLSESLQKQGKDLFLWLLPFEIEFDPEQLKKFSIYEAVEYIIRSFNLVPTSDAYIQFFLDFVFETTQKSVTGLNSFLEKWEQKKDKLSIVVPEAENAVRIMTIHSSKGLEFPVVIYPFANSELQNTRNDNLWLPLNNENVPVAYISASRKMLNWNEDIAGQYKELLAQNELDTLNILYVACTRAAERLYILSNYNEKPKSSPNISDLLVDYLKASGNWSGDRTIEFGQSDGPVHITAPSNTSITSQRFFSSAVQNNAVNIVTKSGSLWDSKQQEAIEKGEIIHEILSWIQASEDLEKAMRKAISTGLITRSSEKEISGVISGIIHHPELNQYFSTDMRILNEKEILSVTGERLRPDRLNFQDRKVTVIDYKTGGFVDKHEKQVQAYARVLKNMGYEVAECLLVYTHDPVSIKKVKEV